jgi:hypothetical protein
MPTIVERVGRRRTYFWLMGSCLTLIVLAWFVVRLFSTTAAVVMSVVAACIPPVAAIVANPWWERGDSDSDNTRDNTENNRQHRFH